MAALRDAGCEPLAFGRSGPPPGHFDAAVWAGGARSSDPAELEAGHVAGPLTALARLASGGRFVYLSSGQVYGRAEVPFRESTEPTASDPYSLAKLRGEAALARAAALSKIQLTILRLPVVYGPGQRGPMFVPSLIEHLVSGRRFAMSPGQQTRDLIFVADVAAGIRRALDADAPAGLYNLGSGVEVRLCDLARSIASACGTNAEKLLDIGAIPYRGDEQMRYVFDIRKIERELGFVPTVDLPDGLARTVAAARSEHE
jgi:nucleoside-diphosphate-sugar epimerase